MYIVFVRRYNIVDMKPDNMEDLTEVITAATYHPINSQLFMFSSSCGQLKLGDLRCVGSIVRSFAALADDALTRRRRGVTGAGWQHLHHLHCSGPHRHDSLTHSLLTLANCPLRLSNTNTHARATAPARSFVVCVRRGAVCSEFKTFFESDNDHTKPFFSEIVASISDIKFSRDGRYAISRDYLRVRIWDLNMSHKALQTIPVNSNLQSKLIELYENDCIFDKFEISVSNDG